MHGLKQTRISIQFQGGMFCYYNDRRVGINVWTKLPRYIVSIEGYSKTTGRTYFRGKGGKALFSTYDAVLIELTPEIELPGDVLPSTAVPGFSTTELGTIAISGTKLTSTILLQCRTRLTRPSQCVLLTTHSLQQDIKSRQII